MTEHQPAPSDVALLLFGGVLFLLGTVMVVLFLGFAVGGQLMVAHGPWSLALGAPVAAFGLWLWKRGKRGVDSVP